MLWILFIASVFISGYILSSVFLNKKDGLLTLVNSFIVGSLFSVTFIYLLTSYVFGNINYGLTSYFIVVMGLLVFRRRMGVDFKSFFTLSRINIFFLIVVFLFSWYLFNKTFSYDVSGGQFLISSNTYLDFGAHIPFIRSFSLGNNFPMEVPFFAGKGLIYHMMFDLYAGIIEHLGLRIDLALNLISTLSFTFLLVLIYKLSLHIFSNKLIGFLSVVFFLFGSDLSFINFLKNNKLDFSIFGSFWHNSFFLVNGPLGVNTVSVFWNLNTFFNQRHLIFGLLFALFFIYFLLDLAKNRKMFGFKKIIIFGVLLGSLPLWHTSIYLAIYFIVFAFFIFEPSIRKQLMLLTITSLIIAFPEILMIKYSSQNSIILNPGFLISAKLSSQNFLTFWFWNLGFGLITIILGFILSNFKQKKLFIIFFLLFIVPNIFQFGRDIYDNHKIFNLWIILANFYSAYFLVRLFSKKIFFKILSIILFILLILSGMLNIMVTKNDVFARIPDYTKNKMMNWAVNNINDRAILLTNGEIYDPLSLVGKRIFLGRFHYVFLYGGDPGQRITQRSTVFDGKDINMVKKIIKYNKIDYIVVYLNGFAKNSQNVNIKFLNDNFHKVYEDNSGIVFKV